MRRPRRPSRPARSERRRSRGDTPWGSRSRRGTFTRRPSAVTTTATRLRLRPWKKSKRPGSKWPRRHDGCAECNGHRARRQPSRPKGNRAATGCPNERDRRDRCDRRERGGERGHADGRADPGQAARQRLTPKPTGDLGGGQRIRAGSPPGPTPACRLRWRRRPAAPCPRRRGSSVVPPRSHPHHTPKVPAWRVARGPGRGRPRAPGATLVRLSARSRSRAPRRHDRTAHPRREDLGPARRQPGPRRAGRPRDRPPPRPRGHQPAGVHRAPQPRDRRPPPGQDGRHGRPRHAHHAARPADGGPAGRGPDPAARDQLRGLRHPDPRLRQRHPGHRPRHRPRAGADPARHDDRLRRLAHGDARGVRGARVRDRDERGRDGPRDPDPAPAPPEDVRGPRGRDASARASAPRTSSSR